MKRKKDHFRDHFFRSNYDLFPPPSYSIEDLDTPRPVEEIERFEKMQAREKLLESE